MTPSSGRKGTKTRHQSGTAFKEYIGGAKDFLVTEAPTLRDVIQKGLLIQEERM